MTDNLAGLQKASVPPGSTISDKDKRCAWKWPAQELFLIGGLPGDLLPVFSPRGSLLQCLFNLRISQAFQPVIELLARIVAGPVGLKPDMQVAEMVEAGATLINGAPAWSVALEIAIWSFHQYLPDLFVLLCNLPGF